MTRLNGAFLEQAGHCRALGSPFMDRLLTMLSAHWPEDTELAAKCSTYTGDIGPKGHSLPLRIASGLHALVLQEADPALALVYPPNAVPDTAFQNEIIAALYRHDAGLTNWITLAPQTNEVRRSAALIGVAHLLARRFGLQFALSELGASAGLNLMFDQFHLHVGAGYGPESDVALTPEWNGDLPPKAQVAVKERRGVDLNPLNSVDAKDALRLQSYLWPDQSERIARTRAAIAMNTATVDKADAIDWLKQRLDTPTKDCIHMVYSTVAWQYFPKDRQIEGTALMEAAGTRATESAPLAWLSYEADGDTRGAALTLRLWPGDVTLSLGRADFHGRWIDWHAPAQLP